MVGSVVRVRLSKDSNQMKLINSIFFTPQNEALSLKEVCFLYLISLNGSPQSALGGIYVMDKSNSSLLNHNLIHIPDGDFDRHIPGISQSRVSS